MKQPSILVIDDSRSVRSTLERKLQETGALVSTAQNGLEGLGLALSTPFDLIITDVEMPGLDGFSVCERLKKHPDTRSTPVIILSTRDADEDLDRGFRAGASAYVVKQHANTELLPRVSEVLSRISLLRNRLILVVDDSRTVREVLGEALVQAGFSVITAANGREALDLLAVQTPDLILSDVKMPELDGAGLCEEVGRIKRLCGVPFVAMSSENDRRVMREMVNKGASAFLTKPFQPEELVILVERLLSDHVLLLVKEKERLKSERNSLLAGIASLIQALEARDNYTRGHSEAVAGLAVRIGRRMGLPSHELEELELAGKLHDIGKIGIRDDILLKPGPLTDEEYEVIKGHPTIGAEILGCIPSLSHILPAILHHHEKFNGSGYPAGLKGEDIPLHARILGVADVFDALTGRRTYREPASPKDTCAIIHKAQGSHLCPKCVAAFLEEMPC